HPPPAPDALTISSPVLRSSLSYSSSSFISPYVRRRTLHSFPTRRSSDLSYQSLSNYLERPQSLHEVHLSKRFYFFLVNVVLPKYDEHYRYAPLQLINHAFYTLHHSLIYHAQ